MDMLTHSLRGTLRVQYLAQGHFNMQSGGVGDWTMHLQTNKQQCTSWATVTPVKKHMTESAAMLWTLINPIFYSDVKVGSGNKILLIGAKVSST